MSGSIVVSGSSTVEPISIAVGDAFADLNPGVAVSVTGPGTGDGFAQFCAGETDISDASRPITAEEVETCAAAGIEFIELKVAIDGLSVVTSAENTDVECLSFVDLYALLGPDCDRHRQLVRRHIHRRRGCRDRHRPRRRAHALPRRAAHRHGAR